MRTTATLTALQQNKNVEEAVKLIPPLKSITLKYLLITINSVDSERSFRSYKGTLCHPKDVPDANLQQPPLVLIKARLEVEK